MEQYQTNTYNHGLVSIVVHRPLLDDQERQKREEGLKRVVASCGKSMLLKQRKG